MASKPIFKTVEEYISTLEGDRKETVIKIRKIINENIPNDFIECINYNMIGWVVPHSIYPNGYHCDPKLPLPLINLASQKSHIGLYHMGIYSDEKLLNWFTQEYKSIVGKNVDMGKSCIQFKKVNEIPYTLIGELVKKVSAEDWINTYETAIKR